MRDNSIFMDLMAYVVRILIWAGVLMIFWNHLASNHALPVLSYVDCVCIMNLLRLFGAVVWGYVEDIEDEEHVCSTCAFSEDCETAKAAEEGEGGFLITKCSSWRKRL